MRKLGAETTLDFRKPEKKKHTHTHTSNTIITQAYQSVKLAMNNLRILLASVFHFVHPVEKDS